MKDDFKITDDFKHLKGLKPNFHDIDLLIGTSYRLKKKEGTYPFGEFYVGTYFSELDKKEDAFHYIIRSIDFGLNADVGISIPLFKAAGSDKPVRLECGIEYNYVFTSDKNTDFVYFYVNLRYLELK